MRRVVAFWSVLTCLSLPAAASAQIVSWTGVNPGDRLGISVANAGDVDGDGFDDVILGVPNYNPSTALPDRGIAYVYSGKAPYGLLATLVPDKNAPDGGGAAYDFFGYAAAGAGDVVNNGNGSAGKPRAEILVGAPKAGCSEQPDGQQCATAAGKVFVFSIDVSQGQTVATRRAILFGDGQSEEEGFFGAALASGPSITGGAARTVAVGAPGRLSTECGAGNGVTGKVYAFEASSSWPLLFTATSLSPAGLSLAFESDAEKFGSAVLVAKTSGDPWPRVVVGAPYFSDPGETGCVDDGTGKQILSGLPQTGRIATYKCTNAQTCNAAVETEYAGTHVYKQLLGYSLAAMSDVNGDGAAELVAGAPGYKAAEDLRPGAAYLLKTGASWTPFAGTPVLGDADRDFFGSTVAVTRSDAVDPGKIVVGAQGVGAPGDLTSTEDPPLRLDRKGAAYVYGFQGFGAAGQQDKCGAGCILQRARTFVGENLEHRFGFALAALPDSDADGDTEFAVSAPEFEPGTASSNVNYGKAYRYDACLAGVVSPQPGIDDNFDDDSLDLCRWNPYNAYYSGRAASTPANGTVWEGTGGACVIRPKARFAQDDLNHVFDGPFTYKTITGDFTLESEFSLYFYDSLSDQRGGVIIVDGATMSGNQKKWLSVTLGREPNAPGNDDDELRVRCTQASTSLDTVIASASKGTMPRVFIKLQRTGGNFDLSYKFAEEDSWVEYPNVCAFNGGIGQDLEVGFGLHYSQAGGSNNSVGFHLAVNEIDVTPTSGGVGIHDDFDTGDCETSWPDMRNGAKAKMFGQDHNALVIAHGNSTGTSMGNTLSAPRVQREAVPGPALDVSARVRSVFISPSNGQYLGMYAIAANPVLSGPHWVGIERTYDRWRVRSYTGGATTPANVAGLGNELVVRIKRGAAAGDVFDFYYWRAGCLGGGVGGWQSLASSVVNGGFTTTSGLPIGAAVNFAVASPGTNIGEFDDLQATQNPDSICP